MRTPGPEISQPSQLLSTEEVELLASERQLTPNPEVLPVHPFLAVLQRILRRRKRKGARGQWLTTVAALGSPGAVRHSQGL